MKYTDIQQQYKKYAMVERDMRVGTYKAADAIMLKLCEFAVTDNLRKLDEKIIRSFMHEMSRERAWSPKTFRLYWQYMKSFFDWAIKEQIIKKNPLVGIDRPKLPSRLPRCLDTEDTLKVLTHARWCEWYYAIEKTRNEAILAVFIFTGVRLSELINLKTEDVNLETEEIFVEQGKNKKDRMIAIHARLLPILRGYVIDRKKRGKPSKWFFTSVRSDKRLTPRDVRAIFKKISVISGIKITPHMLRHTFGKLCVDANVNLRTIQQMMGHSDISTTQIYTFVSTKAMKKNFAGVNLL